MMNFNIGVQHLYSPHLFSDLVELLTIYDYFGKVDVHKNDVISLASGLPHAADEVDEDEEFEESEEVDASKNDKYEARIEDIWSQLEYRNASFGDYYPFDVKGDYISLSTDWSSSEHRIYRFLLAASRLRSFNKDTRQRWAKVFANVSAVSMRSLLPVNAEVKIFDANSEDRKIFYGTDCRKALVKLGEQLNAHEIHYQSIQKQSSSGDGGIDLVGVFSFNDNASGSHVIFGQCGAQEKNWPDKRLEAHPASFRSYFTLLHDIVATMFTPVSYRLATGGWVTDKEVCGVIVLDRLRIMKLLNDAETPADILNKEYFLEFEQEFNSYEIGS